MHNENIVPIRPELLNGHEDIARNVDSLETEGLTQSQAVLVNEMKETLNRLQTLLSTTF